MILGSTVALSLEKEQFDSLKKSRNVLLSAKAIEEKYDLMISNFLELEKELLVQVAQQMVFLQDSYDDFYEIRSVLNRRVVNLLTSTKLYFDQIEKHVRTCLHEDESFGEIAKSYFSKEFDTHPEYRFMEALRNHVQHYGLAVHSISLPRQWVGGEENRQMVNAVKLFSLKEEFCKNKKFRKKTLDELTDKTDLVKATRVYVGSFSNIHHKIRQLIENNVTMARRDIEQTMKRYENVNEGKSIGVYAYSIMSTDPTEQPIDKFPIMLDWDNVRIRLTEKNKKLPNIDKWYVSGSCL